MFYDAKLINSQHVPDQVKEAARQFCEGLEELIEDVCDRAAVKAMPMLTVYGIRTSRQKVAEFLQSKLVPLAVVSFYLSEQALGRAMGQDFQVMILPADGGIEINISLDLESQSLETLAEDDEITADLPTLPIFEPGE